MSLFASFDTGPFYQIFSFFGNCISSVWNELEKVTIYQNVTLPRILLGFIALSALFALFWKGIKG